MLAQAAGFRTLVVPFGSWRSLEPELRRVMRGHARNFVERMGFRGRESYLAVLLPVRENGAESYPQSLALAIESEPSRENEASWANLLGHELFHFWNGWLLRGAEYRSSQWFQEGFTEYAANLSTAATGVLSKDGLREKLAGHVANYRRLKTSLEDYGTTKGPPLYSAGALVAFTWDVMIRDATDGERGLGDFLRALSRRLGGGERAWDREDLIAALGDTAEHDWRSYLDRHVRGAAPLPLAEAFALAGLRLREEAGGVSLEQDPAASARARRTWRRLASGM
jgi:predicted metalloprotease with PDZ domain